MRTLLFTAIAFLLLWPKADAQVQKSAVRVQITYFNPVSENFSVPNAAASRDQLQKYEDAAKARGLMPIMLPGPATSAADGRTASATTATLVASALLRAADGTVIDNHITVLRRHVLTILPRLQPNGMIHVQIGLRDDEKEINDRTHATVHQATSRIIQKPLLFHPGDTLLLTGPVAGTAGNDYVFASVTRIPKPTPPAAKP